MLTVTVLGASGRMGRAQVRELVNAGHSVRAVTRNPGRLEDIPDMARVDVAFGDYRDAASIDLTLAGADALFYGPSPASGPKAMRESANVIAAAQRAGVSLVVLNSKMWAPDEPCGEPTYDHVLDIENLFADSGLPVVTFRPVLFMDNLLTRFAKPGLVEEGVYRYCQRPDMRADWISMDDLAKFMVASLDRPDLIGGRIRIGGPETLSIDDIVAGLSHALGKPIHYEYVAPYDFGVLSHRALGLDHSKVSVESYAEFFESFYTFNNNSPAQPFRVDMNPIRELIPVSLTTFDVWATRQDWSQDSEASGYLGTQSG